MARILSIGIATLDIINEVDGYPSEDTEVRALSQRIACGGNAANTLTVLSLLGHRCAFGGVLAAEPNGVRVRQALETTPASAPIMSTIARGFATPPRSPP